MMKRIISLTLSLLLVIPTIVGATPLGFSGGVQNEHSYEEYVFISGEPILMKGTYRVNERDRKDSKNVSYRFQLKAVGEREATLDRNVTYKTDLNPYKEIGQSTTQTEVDSYRETINIDGDTYTLEDYQFSKSDVIDNRPASDFYEGNIIGRKHYKINGDEGEVNIHMTGGNVGYENFWGRTETQTIDHIIEYEIYEGESWEGKYTHQVSDSLTKSLKYGGDSGTNLSTVSGGYVKTINEEIISRYDYNLKENYGRKNLYQEMVPKVERLIIPKFRDVNGHWAEENIKKLYSLNVFDDDSSVFAPDTPMDREEFTKIVVRASDIRANEEENKKSKRRKKVKEEPYFKDTDVKDENYQYIKAGVDKKIIEGVSSNRFAPNEYLTRAQAITILMRSLGYEMKAPNPGYYMDFNDDSDIPNWARDSIYMARKIGLITGDENNNVNPMEELTRAEASTLVINYLEFLEKGLQKDHRENIINYN